MGRNSSEREMTGDECEVFSFLGWGGAAATSGSGGPFASAGHGFLGRAGGILVFGK